MKANQFHERLFFSHSHRTLLVQIIVVLIASGMVIIYCQLDCENPQIKSSRQENLEHNYSKKINR